MGAGAHADTAESPVEYVRAPLANAVVPPACSRRQDCRVVACRATLRAGRSGGVWW